MSPKQLALEVSKHEWYHRIDLGNGIITPGWAPLDPAVYRVPDDLHGKTVLDIGAWDGYWTFEALKRGAKHAVAIDDFSDSTHDSKQRKRGWQTFDLCWGALGLYPNCERVEMSVYELSTQSPALPFDVIFAFGVLYHLRHPLLGLDNMAAVCAPGGDLFIESAICDDFSPYRKGFGGGYAGHMVSEFYPGSEYGGNASNWWVPTLRCLRAMVAAAGFAVQNSWKISGPKDVTQCRGFIHARMPSC